MAKTSFRRLSAALSVLLSLGAVVLASGCARVGAVSEVGPDGSMTRTVTLKSLGPGGGGGGGFGPSSGTPDQIVDAPKREGWTLTRGTPEGDLIFSATRKVPAGEVVRDIVLRDEPEKPPMADPFTDKPAPAATPAAPPAPGKGTKGKLAPQKPPVRKPAPSVTPSFPPPAKPKPGRVLVTNEVSVRQVAPGRLEYREVLRWNGPRPDNVTQADA
jgi:hypothetical protein